MTPPVRIIILGALSVALLSACASAPMRATAIPQRKVVLPAPVALRQITLPAHARAGVWVQSTPDWVRSGAHISAIRFIGKTHYAPTSVSESKRWYLPHKGAGAHAHPIAHVGGPARAPNAAPAPGTKARAPVLRVFFATNWTRVSTKSASKAHKLSDHAGQYCLVGHADPRGDNAFNLRLSVRRDLSVAATLHATIEIEAFGKVGANKHHSSYGFDRRVDVFRGLCPHAMRHTP